MAHWAALCAFRAAAEVKPCATLQAEGKATSSGGPRSQGCQGDSGKSRSAPTFQRAVSGGGGDDVVMADDVNKVCLTDCGLAAIGCRATGWSLEGWYMWVVRGIPRKVPLCSMGFSTFCPPPPVVNTCQRCMSWQEWLGKREEHRSEDVS